ncbi:MAG TPA: 1-deoxy-D-xylulose-5-phosphate reductoisomerase [Rikenellaceae bacterium]|mgnify:FL=1|nr:1-deoxy-D-xylulose-5-phosphate reductoisomerase [Rikenellaceae bacterium]
MNKRKIAILGSTGSIGTQALDVIRQHRDLFDVELISANRNIDLLSQQAVEFDANNVVICDETFYPTLSDNLKNTDSKVFAGIESLCALVSAPDVDIVLGAMVGFSGLRPTLAALEAGKIVALANKETLVAAGSIVTRTMREHNAVILPVDSEHSAIFQCLLAAQGNTLTRIHLTASGGPFREWDKDRISKATVSDALKHPNWNMGAKVTIDSATMMNKGFEMIEACWLFDVEPSMINIVVHPESIIHSMIEFEDGAVLAQMGCPDMREPIGLALSFPQRLSVGNKKLDFAQLASLHFEAPDEERFPNLGLARSAFRRGGNIPCVLNAANEVAVKAFIEGKLSFYGISDLIEDCLNGATFVANPSLEDIFHTHEETVRIALSKI